MLIDLGWVEMVSKRKPLGQGRVCINLSRPTPDVRLPFCPLNIKPYLRLGFIWVPSLCTAHCLSSSTFSLRRYLSFLFPILSIVSLSHLEISMFWNKIRYFSLFLLSPFFHFVVSLSLILRSQVLEQNGLQFSRLSDSHS